MFEKHKNGARSNVVPFSKSTRNFRDARHVITFIDQILIEDLENILSSMETLTYLSEITSLKAPFQIILDSVKKTEPWTTNGLNARNAAQVLATEIHIKAKVYIDNNHATRTL